ncbi:hypothetical protein AYO22_01255 [Fonsecaea multimorphosa]|nr:hypothetical protein AYO22_01255 [Fonsecaea multimorphosa]
MLEQATTGDVDAITGDYLAEFNLASNALAHKSSQHPGWERTCEDGLLQTIQVANEKRLKIVVNGGAINPKGLAELVQSKVDENNYSLKVSYVQGDNVLSRLGEIFSTSTYSHLDSNRARVKLNKATHSFLDTQKEIISAHAYLGARGITAALRAGADIVITGRVADASPAVGLAAWWHNWSEHEFDKLAGAFVAGHLIECACYSTGGNFCGFTKFETEDLVNLGYPIVEIEHDGTFVLTKHEQLKGFVTVDTARAQLLYEIQGNIYLNSDVKADLQDIIMVQEGPNRVRVSGVKGHPPPPTTKLALFYIGGYQAEWIFGATGTHEEVKAKWRLLEAQIKWILKRRAIREDQFDELQFQHLGVPEANPRSQESGTAVCRVFAQSEDEAVVRQVFEAWTETSMQHYSGMHTPLDIRTAVPKPYLAYFPALIPQSSLHETATILKPETIIEAGNVTVVEELLPSLDYDTKDPVPLEQFGPTVNVPMGQVVYARSGDKGANANVGFWVQQQDEYDWLRSALSKKEMIRILGDDWKDEYHLERVEMPGIFAVHFVIYGILGRGVCSSSRLDNFSKGVADYLRSKFMDVPTLFTKRYNKD